MKKETFRIYLIFIFVLMAFPVSASFEIDGNSSFIEKKYLGGDFVNGKLYMNFSDQENAEFISNFGEIGTELMRLIESENYIKGEDYFCDPVSCEGDYDASYGEERKVVELDERRMYGFKLSGENVEKINNFKMEITSSGESCENQVFIDLFNDGEINFFNTQHKETSCVSEKDNMGCFKENAVEDEMAVIDSVPYCEKISLLAGPAYKIGAVIKAGDSVGELKMKILNTAGSSFSCDPELNLGETGLQQVGCIIDRFSKGGSEVFVCISDEAETRGGHKIRYSQSEDSCGIKSTTPYQATELTADYEIYAVPLKYASFDTIEFNRDLYEYLNGDDKDLFSDIEEYIEKVYGSDCSNKCVIPFSIWGENPQATLENVNIEYQKQGVATASTPYIYDVTEKPFTLTTPTHMVFDVEDMKFKVPDENGQHEFELYFDKENERDPIIEETINVEIGFDFTLGPRLALIGQSTTFTAFTSQNISSSTWDFGDGELPIISYNKQAQHTYLEEGEFIIEVKLTNDKGKSSAKKFKVIIGEPKISAELTIRSYESRIDGIKDFIESLPLWVGEEIKTQMLLEEIETELANIRTRFNALGDDEPDESYVEIINELLASFIPYSIYISENWDLPADIGFNNIDPEYIAEKSGAEDFSESDARNGIINWIADNYNIDVELETISAIGDLGEGNLLKKYKIDLVKKSTATGESSYLIINYPIEFIVFKIYYDEEPISGGNAAIIPIDSSGSPSSIEFLIWEVDGSAPDIEYLGIYISPLLGELKPSSKPIDFDNLFRDTEGKFKWGFFSIAIAILLTITFAVYILLQTWYKKYYEKHLFKNPNDLYNLINFIYNSRRSGLKDSMIRKKLSEKKWKGEQTTYAFKKIDGKRTGMWEIPIFKFVENRRVKKELEKKQGGPIDARFIKQPNL